MITRSLAGTVEISTAALTVTSKPPAFTGENGALSVSLSFTNGGTAQDISDYVCEMFLYWPERRQMTDSVTMTVSGSTASGVFPDTLTVLPGAPLMIVQLTDAGTGALIVACAQPIQITDTRGDQVITIRPPTPSEVIYVGRSPYVNSNGNWMEWDTDTGAYVDTGVSAKGDTGTSIVSITKTATSGLVDTYTILLSDGDTHTFTVTNGSDISSVAKTGTSGLVDTWTITLTNGNTHTFTVTNGRGISSVTGPVSSGLVDTYTINYNDNTTSTFTVTNGTGIASIVRTYQEGSSGTTPPTGTWVSNPPTVAQGKYLWTKIVITETDNPATVTTAYSVAYQGVDGNGTVNTVDSIAASSGNVTLLTIGTTAPTSSTSGSVGSRYFDKNAGVLYICTASSGGSQTWTMAGSNITVDSALSNSSPNPVQNQVITAALANKWTEIKLQIPSSGTGSFATGQSWPSGSAPLGYSDLTCDLATLTTDASGNPIVCAEGDDFKLSEYDSGLCTAPLWVYVGTNTIYVAARNNKAPTSSVKISGVILHK